MGCRLMGRRPTFILMIVLTTSFFIVEIVVGYVCNSMALVADSFHMLSDIISLVVGYFALQLSQKTSSSMITKNTYGWVRAEVLGALVNSVFLFALCLSILISALDRLVSPEGLNNPMLILIVGGVGLLVNLAGMLLFHGHAGGGHGHSHGGGGHGHSHGGGGHGHSHSHKKSSKKQPDDNDNHVNKNDKQTVIENGFHHEIPFSKCNGNSLAPPSVKTPPPSPQMRRFQERTKRVEVILNGDVGSHDAHEIDIPKDATRRTSKSEGQLNMKGVYLHILGDALGSIIVIISAIIVKYVDGHWTRYVDPIMSIIMVGIILYSTLPLLTESSKILLQNVPPHINLKLLESRLLNRFPEILGIHEFHVWQLAGSKVIASVHIKFTSINDYKRLAPQLKEFFDSEGIHSTTFQPEIEEDDQHVYKACLLACESKSCQDKMCCSFKELNKIGRDVENNNKIISNRHTIADEIAKDVIEDEGKAPLKGKKIPCCEHSCCASNKRHSNANDASSVKIDVILDSDRISQPDVAVIDDTFVKVDGLTEFT